MESSIDTLLLQLQSELDVLKAADLRARFVGYINHLLLNDFNRLINLLYRVDVDEQGLKQALQAQSGRDAAEVIADLIIERQRQKGASRLDPPAPTAEASGDEAW